jgi:hypothetical protein
MDEMDEMDEAPDADIRPRIFGKSLREEILAAPTNPPSSI